LNLSKSALGRAALILATVIWGISFVLMDFALGSVPTFYILAIRFTGAAVILFAISAKRLKKIDRAYVKWGAVLGAALLAAYALQTFGLQFTTPGKNAFLTTTYCIIVPFLHWVFSRQKPDRFNFMAAVLCVAGIGLISLNDFSVGLGDGLTILCGAMYAVHIVALGAAIKGRDFLVLSALQFAFAGALSWICGLLTQPFPEVIPANTAAALAFLTVMSTALCLTLQVFGQKHTPPTQASIIMALEAVFGAAASLAVGSEIITPRLAFGFALTFVSVIVSETKLSFLRRKRESEEVLE
jgi:drug/metabolite transporter (DMT)-like permease